MRLIKLAKSCMRQAEARLKNWDPSKFEGGDVNFNYPDVASITVRKKRGRKSKTGKARF